jgi:hypothetical protein
MTVPALVHLMVRRAEADGAVVVAFFGLARRHFLLFGGVDRSSVALFGNGGLCSGLAAWFRVDSA